MGAPLLHQGATVCCAHAGQASPTSTNPRVKLSGQDTVVQSDLYSVSACSLPPPSGGPCTSASWVSAATRVQSGGRPLLLQSSVATCVPTGTSLIVQTTQTRVRGI